MVFLNQVRVLIRHKKKP